MKNVKNLAARGSPAEMPEAEFEQAVAEEVARLKAEGHGKAYICERSLEIEDMIRQRFV